MFMFCRQMGGQVDSERERAAIPGRGVRYLLVCICTPVHICLCFFHAGKWAGGGTAKGRVCARLELVTHIQESVMFHAGKWMGGGTGKGQAHVQFL
jgi:hypothetical protein